MNEYLKEHIEHIDEPRKAIEKTENYANKKTDKH